MIYRSLLLAALLAALASNAYADDTAPAPEPVKIPANVWKADRAMHDIATQLSFGSRAMDTAGHEMTVVFIEKELAKTKAASVTGQQWIETGGGEAGSSFLGWGHRRKSGPQHAMVNIVARFYPDNPRRIIVGTHYDSIIRAYRDKKHPEAVMPGANNSASGVALLLETARALASLPPPPVGIDFVFFDGEEGTKSLGAGDAEGHTLGSPYFAQNLMEFYPDEKPESAIVFDMVCYKNLKLKREPISVKYAKDQVEKFWSIGSTLAPSIFTQESYPFGIEDDHFALIKAGIPSFLVIGFEYEPWFNTTKDTIDKCSKKSLESVGRTLLNYIYALE